MLVLRDLKARSEQAYLGYFWILVQPLLLTGVFTFLVQRVLGRADLSRDAVSAVPHGRRSAVAVLRDQPHR